MWRTGQAGAEVEVQRMCQVEGQGMCWFERKGWVEAQRTCFVEGRRKGWVEAAAGWRLPMLEEMPGQGLEC